NARKVYVRRAARLDTRNVRSRYTNDDRLRAAKSAVGRYFQRIAANAGFDQRQKIVVGFDRYGKILSGCDLSLRNTADRNLRKFRNLTLFRNDVSRTLNRIRK